MIIAIIILSMIVLGLSLYVLLLRADNKAFKSNIKILCECQKLYIDRWNREEDLRKDFRRLVRSFYQGLGKVEEVVAERDPLPPAPAVPPAPPKG